MNKFSAAENSATHFQVFFYTDEAENTKLCVAFGVVISFFRRGTLYSPTAHWSYGPISPTVSRQFLDRQFLDWVRDRDMVRVRVRVRVRTIGS